MNEQARLPLDDLTLQVEHRNGKLAAAIRQCVRDYPDDIGMTLRAEALADVLGEYLYCHVTNQGGFDSGSNAELRAGAIRSIIDRMLESYERRRKASWGNAI
jgi:hypothetical protein